MTMDPPSLFSGDDDSRPLADRLRPTRLEDVVGQNHLLAADAPLGRMISQQRLQSIILWGPPGCGKTTIARLLAERTKLIFEPLSATFAGVTDLRKVFQSAQKRQEVGQGTLLFVDEIHRFNRAQQDSFLPYVEDGTIVLVGATTENPSFELNGALLSRCQVLILRRLDAPALDALVLRAEQVIGRPLPVDADARAALSALADGDGRYLLNMVEQLFSLPPTDAPLQVSGLADVVQKRAPIYDKTQESHYNLISVLHKSMRGSDPDAALYWLARMLDGGEDPLYVVRRLVRFANEDIGIADPQAVQQALAAWDVYERLGSPEGELAIAQAVVYLATSPKSIAVYRGLNAAMKAARTTGSLAPPLHSLNAPTRLMKDIGYGKDYSYDPDSPDGFSGANYFPDDMDRQIFYQPSDFGHEQNVRKRLAYWADLRSKARKPGRSPED
ncbi:replication-associated recombination protein A [Rhodococcus fascians]|nr:replication-associated recombination protein A [Rhodococcus fascians]MBY3999513.1 replication-associated recombination protein A [Rhodococcus fascians]MBY4005046.1 replication-associated recombination protein A [Rhodococcus fascians]MBY4010081.1 replication-associated recombination protein A [Rhodococcus fascians]MBY4020253.1 replication-associated recombination protein A [Rhodococcus fascians]